MRRQESRLKKAPGSHKVRTGCDTCKKRRVKCDEGKPFCQRCINFPRQCEGYGGVPKAWTFKASDKRKQNLSLVWASVPPDAGSDKSLSSTISGTGALSSSSSSSPGSKTQNQSSLPDRVLYSPSIEQALARWQFWSQSFLAPRNKAPEEMGDLWGVVIPQLGWTHDPLRHFMTATGILADALLRGVGSDASSGAHLVALSYVNHGIRLLREESSSAFVILVTAWTLWQFDMMRGDTRGALVHLKNGRSLATSKDLKIEASDVTEKIIEGIVSAMRSDLASLVSEEMFDELGDDVRKKKSFVVATLGVAEIEIAEARGQVARSSVPGKAELLHGLNMLMPEIRWMRERWKLDEQVYQGIVPSLYGKCLSTLREYLQGKIDLDVPAFVQLLGRYLTFFSVQIAGADRQMRLDLTMLLQYGNQLRRSAREEIVSTAHKGEVTQQGERENKRRER